MESYNNNKGISFFKIFKPVSPTFYLTSTDPAFQYQTQKNIQNTTRNTVFKEFLIYILVESSQIEGSKLLLYKILQEDNYNNQTIIFYHPHPSPTYHQIGIL